MKSQPLAKAVGGNCRRIRTAIGLTQDELAQYARASGLKWDAAKVGRFESGAVAPTLGTVLVVGDALAWAAAVARFEDEVGFTGGRSSSPPRVTLADLLGGDGAVELTDSRTVQATDLADVARGGEFRFWGGAVESTVFQRSGLTEERIAKSLGISTSRLSEISFELWQCTFSEERDRRAGPDANQQKKGRISRELRSELAKELAGGDDQ